VIVVLVRAKPMVAERAVSATGWAPPPRCAY